MRLRKGVLMTLSLALLLSGCGPGEAKPEQEALKLRETYQNLTGFQAQAEVTADYGDRAYQYTIQCSGNAQVGSLTVIAPESIAGAGTAWADGKTSLDYEGISLETGQLSPDGLSPADALPVLLTACASGAVVESGWTDWEEERCLYLLIQNPNAQESQIALWANPETWALCQAEIRWEEQRVISFTFTDFVLETAEPSAQ
ncbi:MAG: hypothetical protein ACI3VN_00650 [Candidatus Onthomonas sp.]